MKKLFLLLLACTAFVGCKDKTDNGTNNKTKDTLRYAYKATYSSDVTVPSNPVNAQKVLQVWKMFETMDIQAMKPYFADSVRYNDASGMHFYGPVEKLLAYAKKDVESLDSMRFDIVVWQSAHLNDRNEDWVNIWSRERRYSKKAKPDTVLMQENWRVKNGKVVYFDQYLAKQ